MKPAKKILYVNPPLSADQRYGLLSQAGALEPPLGLAYLAGVTRAAGVESMIMDAQALKFDLEESLDFVEREHPEFLAITMTTMLLDSASLLAVSVKASMPGVTIIAGGCHLSALPEETMRDNSAFDIGIIGEGERTIEELLNVLIGKGDLSTVKGIVFRDNSRLIVNPARERIKDLDQLPMPAFDLLPELRKYYRSATQSIRCLPTISLVTSRGCSGHCTFCDRNVFGNQIRMHSASYIVEMIELLIDKFHIKGLVFEDDNFFLSKDRLVQMAELLKRRRINIPWVALSRVDSISEEKLNIARSCGCWQILYGIESGSQEILDSYHKGVTLEQIEQAVRLTKKHRIYTKGFFIWGNPPETEKTIEETREFINRVPFDDISMTFFTPYPGADVWKDIDKFGSCNKDFSELNCFKPVFFPRGISKEKLLSSQIEILSQFYRRPRIYYSYLSRIRSFGQIKQLYKSWRALSEYSKGGGLEKEVVINADDLGLCKGVNDGAVRLLEKGVLGSVSVIAGGESVQQAVDILKNYSDVGIGVHLYLTNLGPISDKNKIPSLLTKAAIFDNNIYRFLLRYFFVGVKKDEILREFRAQIEKLRKLGFKITHLDSHQYIHMLPGIFKISLILAREYGIAYIRLPFTPVDRRYFFNKASLSRKVWQLILNILCIIYRPLIKGSGMKERYYSFGFLNNGHLTGEAIKDIFVSLGEGRSELVCHPGTKECMQDRYTRDWGYQWEKELEVLTSGIIKEEADKNYVKLIKLKY